MVPCSSYPVKSLRRTVVALFGLVLVVVPAPGAMVINEIHYNPDVKTEPAEFVELYNNGANVVNLAGWSLSTETAFTFPATNVAAGGYVALNPNPASRRPKGGSGGAAAPVRTDNRLRLPRQWPSQIRFEIETVTVGPGGCCAQIPVAFGKLACDF